MSLIFETMVQKNIDEIINNIYKDDAFTVIQDVNATAIGDLAKAINWFIMQKQGKQQKQLLFHIYRKIVI